jgi:N-acetylmuramoyl-L-alanine amidase
VRHAVVRGETLSGIAERYRVSLDRLINSNQLKNDRIRIGQVLTIPRG